MKISPGKLVSGINDFIFEWKKLGIVSDSRLHSSFKKSGSLIEVSWANDGYVLKDEQFASLSEYINLVENRQYSLLMDRGDMFQISFTLNRDQLVKHRLCWYPCPIRLSRDEIENSNVVDAIVERMNNAEVKDFYSKSPIRFDFDPKGATEKHPVSHLHLISEDCRIPVKTPLCLRKFMDFVTSNFYTDLEEICKLNNSTITWNRIDSLTAGQKKKLHLNIF